MSELYDVTIASTGYMVKPGTYQRYQDGQSEGRVGRVRLFDFYGGANRTAQLERDRFMGGVGSWPTLDSQGVIAGPKKIDRTLTPSTFSPSSQHWSFVYNGTPYVVADSRLYNVDLSAGAFGDLSVKRILATTVVDCTQVGSTLYFAYGSSAAIGSYDLASSTYTASVFGSTSAFQARLIGHEANTVMYVKASDNTSVYNSAGAAQMQTDGYIRRLVLVDGHLWVLTEQSILRFTDASTWSAEATMPRLGANDDVAWAVTHFGRLFSWIGKEVVYYDTTDDSFKGTGLRGRATYGACTVGSYLVVVLDNMTTAGREMWAYDGRGWWMLEDGSDDDYYYPVSIVGYANDADMLAGRGTTSQNAETWQFFPNSTNVGMRDSFELITALMDAGERDLDKVWRRAGVEIATPDDRASSDEVTVTLSYSSDGGATWTQLATDTLSESDSRLVSIGGSITTRPTSRFLQLRVAVSSISDWCPVIVGLWAEHETMDLPTRRRRWRFTVVCADQVIERDGSVDTTGARDLATGLWDTWDDGAVVTFKDVDYDQTTTSYNVRIAGIREMVTKPADIAIASSEIELTLVEV